MFPTMLKLRETSYFIQDNSMFLSAPVANFWSDWDKHNVSKTSIRYLVCEYFCLSYSGKIFRLSNCNCCSLTTCNGCSLTMKQTNPIIPHYFTAFSSCLFFLIVLIQRPLVAGKYSLNKAEITSVIEKLLKYCSKRQVVDERLYLGCLKKYTALK